MKVDLSKYIVPTLGGLCAIGALMVVSGMRTPFVIDAEADSGGAELRLPGNLLLEGFIPAMEEVLAKHLFVPERTATGENAFPDLVVKGVYVGTERNAVLSLKSKPTANLRVWQGDEDAALSMVDDARDPRRPIVDFLSEWGIKSIDFGGVTVEHLITGEVETYAVDYTPQKKIKDSAQSGYGQGFIADTTPAAAKAPAATTAAQARPAQQGTPGFSPQTAAGRVGAFMQRLSPQQRQQFMQQLQKQQQQGGGNRKAAAAQQKKSNDAAGGKKGSKKNR